LPSRLWSRSFWTERSMKKRIGTGRRLIRSRQRLTGFTTWCEDENLRLYSVRHHRKFFALWRPFSVAHIFSKSVLVYSSIRFHNLAWNDSISIYLQQQDQHFMTKPFHRIAGHTKHIYSFATSKFTNNPIGRGCKIFGSHSNASRVGHSHVAIGGLLRPGPIRDLSFKRFLHAIADPHGNFPVLAALRVRFQDIVDCEVI